MPTLKVFHLLKQYGSEIPTKTQHQNYNVFIHYL